MLGDVSGKAAPAALFAALVSGIMRSAAQQKLAPAAMLAALNDALQERKLDSQYVTMLFAVWNDENQTLQVANSGAVQPVFCRAGESITVQAEGFPLGMFPNVTYEEFSVATQPGDAIVFVSDGILDAENDKDEMYGDERLASLLCASRDLPAQQIADTILADVTRFQGGHDRFDDETIIVLRVRSSRPTGTVRATDQSRFRNADQVSAPSWQQWTTTSGICTFTNDRLNCTIPGDHVAHTTKNA